MEQRINLDRMEQAAELFGSFDGNMKQLEQRYGVALVFRDSELKITGEDPEAVDKAARVVKSLITLIGGGETLTDQNVRYCMQMVEEDGDDKVARLAGTASASPARASPSSPRPWASAPTATIFGTTPSPSVWGLPAPARPTWRWPWR